MKVEDFAFHFLKNVTIRAEIAVALYMSAWIEIENWRDFRFAFIRRTLYECVILNDCVLNGMTFLEIMILQHPLSDTKAFKIDCSIVQ